MINQKTIHCEGCGKRCEAGSNLHNHVRVMKRLETARAYKPHGGIFCCYCGKQFEESDRESYAAHRRQEMKAVFSNILKRQ